MADHELWVAQDIRDAQEPIAELARHTNQCAEEYQRVLTYFHLNEANKMNTETFLQLWDNLFIPKDVVLKKPEKFLKAHLEPRFCRQNKEITADSLMLLWDLCTVDQLQEKEKRPRVPRRQSRTQNRGQRGGHIPVPSVSVGHFAQKWRTNARKSTLARSS